MDSDTYISRTIGTTLLLVASATSLMSFPSELVRIEGLSPVPASKRTNKAERKAKRKSKFRPVHVMIVLRPGFEPGSPARKAGILDPTILPEPFTNATCKIWFRSNKSYPSTAFFKHSSKGANIVSALFSIGA